MKKILLSSILTSFILNAQTFNISNTPEFRDALKISANNSEDDIIILSDGTYKTTDDGKGTFIYISEEDKNLTIIGSTSKNIILSGDNINQILNHKSTKNSSIILKNLTFVDSYNKAYTVKPYLGGAIYTDYNLEIINCDFKDNIAEDKGGAFYSDNDVTVINSTFTNNTSRNKGGAFYSSNNVSIINSTFKSNTTRYSGGAFYANNDATIINSVFKSNKAAYAGGSSYNDNRDKYSGGGFRSSYATIIDSSFIDNYTEYAGGGFYSSKGATINNTTFINNTAKSGGGFESSKNVDLNNSIFKNNIAETSGGGFSSSKAIVLNSIFINNNTERYGGGFSSSGAIVSNSTFVDNYAENKGGGFRSYSNREVIINNSVFTNNSSSMGGGFYSFGKSTVLNSTFSNNNAENTGGGFLSFHYTIVSGSIFKNNSSKLLGGGFSSSNVIVNNSIFENNSVNGSGGGFESSNNAILSNSIFINNSANYGGSIYTSSINMSNSTLVNNTSGIYLDSGESHLIINSIFDNNSTEIKGNSNVAILNLKNNYIDMSKVTVSNFEENNIFTDINLGLNSDYSIGDDSDLIDSGNIEYLDKFTNMLKVDFIGNKRLIGKSIDIGAYEYSSTKPIINSISFSGEMKAYETITLNVDSTAIDDRSIISTEYDFNNDGIFSSNSSVTYKEGNYTIKIKVIDNKGDYNIIQKNIIITPLLFEDMTLEQKLKSLIYNPLKINSIIEKINKIKIISTDNILTSKDIDNLFSGWHLIATEGAIVDLSVFSSAKIIWIYNNSNSLWSAYSSNKDIKSSIQNTVNISLIKSIPKNSGIWILK